MISASRDDVLSVVGAYTDEAAIRKSAPVTALFAVARWRSHDGRVAFCERLLSSCRPAREPREHGLHALINSVKTKMALLPDEGRLHVVEGVMLISTSENVCRKGRTALVRPCQCRDFQA